MSKWGDLAWGRFKEKAVQMILVLCLRAGERIISIHEFIFGFAGPNIQPAAQPSFPGPSETDLEDLWGRYSLLVLSPLLFIPSPSCTHDSGELEHEPLALFWWDRSACTYVPSTSPELVPNDAVCLDMCLSSSRESMACWQANTRVPPPCKLLLCSLTLHLPSACTRNCSDPTGSS